MSFIKNLFRKKKKKKIDHPGQIVVSHQQPNNFKFPLEEERKEGISPKLERKWSKGSKGRSSKPRKSVIAKCNKVNIHTLWDSNTDYKPMCQKPSREEAYLKIVQSKKFQQIFQ